MIITILEHILFSERQKKRLADLGTVEYFDYGENISVDVALKKTKESDVVVVNWIDPSPFILSLKPCALVSLLSTGYGWVQHLKEARDKGVLISNIPAYATEAVAEHIFGLLLSYTKRINTSSNFARTNDSRPINMTMFGRGVIIPAFQPSKVGIELKGKTLGIIGLGCIGSRVAELATAFGMTIITYNRNKKNNSLARDVSLDNLLSTSDIICITCSLNDQSKGLVNNSNISKIKDGAILTGATWGVIEEKALKSALESGAIDGVAFDIALEGSEKLQNVDMLGHPRFLCTIHNAYNTKEAAERQRDICIDNIESFKKGIEKNIIN